jgi:hypothetical protein
VNSLLVLGQELLAAGHKSVLKLHRRTLGGKGRERGL